MKNIVKKIRRVLTVMLGGFLILNTAVRIGASLNGWQAHEPDTQSIVEAHRHDFNCYTVQDFLNSHGGYRNYVRSLGGVFREYVDFEGPVMNTTEFLEVAEYVWGLYDIWGIDYSNGCNIHGGETWEERQYKAFAGADGAFYPDVYDLTGRRWSNYADPAIAGNKALTIDEMLGNPDRYYAVTNCGQGVSQLLKKAGLIDETWEDPGYYPYKYSHEYGWSYTVIRDAADLQPGDVLIYDNTAGMSFPDRDTVTDVGNYYGGIDHTNIVVDRNEQEGTLTFYDAGKGYTYYGECRYTRQIGEWPYEFASDWIGLRFDNIAAQLGGEGARRYQFDNEKDAEKVYSDFLRRCLWFMSSFSLKAADYTYGVILSLAGLGIAQFPFIRMLFSTLLGLSGFFILCRILLMYAGSILSGDSRREPGSTGMLTRMISILLILTLTPVLFTVLSDITSSAVNAFPGALKENMIPSDVLLAASAVDFSADPDQQISFLPQEENDQPLLEVITGETINETVRTDNGDTVFRYFPDTANIALILLMSAASLWCMIRMSLQIIQRLLGLAGKMLTGVYAVTSIIDPNDSTAGQWFRSCMEDYLAMVKQIIILWLSIRISVSLPDSFPPLAKGIFFIAALAAASALEPSPSITSVFRIPSFRMFSGMIHQRKKQ